MLYVTDPIERCPITSLADYVRRIRNEKNLSLAQVSARSRGQISNIYNEFFRPVGTDRQLLTGLPVSPSLTLVLSLNRKKRDFTESDRRLLILLRPHLIAAFQNAEALARLQLQQIQLEVALEESGGGAILIDADGQVRLATGQARTWLAKYFGAPHGSVTNLPDELRAWLVHHTARATPEGLASAVRSLEIIKADARLRVSLLRSNTSDQTLLLLEEEASFSSSFPESLGLTHREAEVLSWVAQGKTNPEIAILCDISVRTVQKHLEHIYQKLGVETRTAAAQRMHTINQGGSGRMR